MNKSKWQYSKKYGLMSIIFLLFSGQLFAADPVIYQGFFSDKAVSGYDTVAYFSDSKPIKGNKKYTYEYKGAIWYFKNQQNLDKFVITPEAYAPQYGGYCAWSVSQGNNASGNPQYWHILKGKLYLNYDEEIQERWLANKEQFIIDADENWPAVLK